MMRSPVSGLRRLRRRLQLLEQAVADLAAVADRSQHRLFEVGGVNDDIRAIVGDMEARLERVESAVPATSGSVLDAVNYGVRHQPLSSSVTRVLFLVHHIESWDAYDALVRELRAQPDFHVVVASIPRRFRGSTDLEDEDKVHTGLDERGVEHLRLTMSTDADRLALVRALAPDVIFRQSQWDDDVPAAFSTRNLSFARLCLVPYETMNIVQNFPIEGVANSAVDNYFHRAAWRVFCTGPLMRTIAERDGSLGGAQFVVTGHPKADRLRTAEPSWPIDRPGPRRRRVVWSAHHTIGTDWTDFGMVHVVARDMIAWAEERPDIDFVLMPHPALRPFINDPASPVTPHEADLFVKRWDELPNTAVVTTGDYAPVLAASDAMVVDGLSMLVEYQFMTRPLIFLERAGHRPFNEVGEKVLRGAHAVPSLSRARELVERFLSGTPDPLAPRQVENVRELFGEEPAVPRIVAALRAAIEAERPRVGSV